MKNHTNPFSQTGNGPVIAGLLLYILVTLAGIGMLLYWLWRFVASLI